MKNIHESFLNKFKRIYVYCCDPGSFYAAEPIYDDMKKAGKEMFWVFEGWCARNKHGMKDTEDADSFRENIENLKSKNVCVLIGAQVDYNLNYRMIDLCREHGIYSIFLFDYWSNYRRNFQDGIDSPVHLTDAVFIMDEIAKKGLVKELSPVITDKRFFDNVLIIGHRGIEKTVYCIKTMDTEKISGFKKQFNPANKHLVLFVLEPLENDFGYLESGEPFLGFHEFSSINYFFNDMDYNDAKILIKPHPRHEKGIIDRFIKDSFSDTFDYEIIENIDLNLLLGAVEEVVGMTSTVLIIALKCGKKIKSIQVNRNHNGIKLSNPYLEKYIIQK